MKFMLFPATAVLVMAGASAAHAQTFIPLLTQTVGSGANESFLTVDFQDGTAIHSYAFGYFYDGGKTGADLLSAVSSGAGLSTTYLFNGGVVNGYSFDGHFEAGFTNTNSWAYSLGTDGQTWKSSGSGIKGRPLSNGSWDGWSWDVGNANPFPTTPSAAPVPEASSAVSLGILALLGAGFIAIRRKKTA